MGWDAPARRGWVGVGASWADDQEEERIRREAAWDPGRRLGQLGDEWQRDPVMAGIHTALLPLEPFNAGVEYLGGLGQGVAQAVMERYGSDPFGRLGQINQESATRPWADVPVVGGLARAAEVSQRAGWELGTAIPRMAWSEANGEVRPKLLPRALREMPHELGDEATRLDPETRNIFDPGEAVARFRALTPEPAQMGIQMLAGMGTGAVTKPVAGALGAVGDAVGAKGLLAPGQGAWGGLENQALLEGKLLDPVTGAHAPPSLMDKVVAGAVSPAAKFGAMPLTPLAAGIAAANPLDPSMDPYQRAERFAEGAMGGLALGAITLGAQNSLQSIARIQGRFPEAASNPMGRVLDKLSQDLEDRQRTENYYEGRPRPVTMQGQPASAKIPALYPEGLGGSATANLWWAGVRQRISDPYAMLQDVTDSLFNIGGKKGIALTDDENLAGQARTLAGSPEKIAEWYQYGVPVAGAPAHRVILGIKPILFDAGVRNTDQMRDLEDLHLARVALSRSTRQVQKVDPTTGLVTMEDAPLATGHLGMDPVAQQAHIDTQMQLIDDRNPDIPGAGQKYMQASDQMTEFFNALGDHYADSGMFNKAAWAEAKARNDVYGYIQSANEQFDAMWRRPEEPTRPITPVSQPIGKYWSEDDPTHVVKFDLVDQLQRSAKLIQISDMNRFAQNVTHTAGMFPDELGSIWRPLDRSKSSIEKGWRQVQYFEDGTPHAVQTIEELADSMRGVNTEAADAVTGAMAKVSNAFRQGVTVWSVPFIMANVPRDIYHASVNTGMPLDVMRNWMPAMMSMATKDLDEWFRYHQGNNMVARLPETIWNGVRDYVFKPLGADPDSARRMLESGAGMSTMMSVLQGQERSFGSRIPDMLEVKAPVRNVWDAMGRGASIGVHGPTDMLEAMANLGEMSTRLAVFRAAEKNGYSPLQQVLATREATVDFSKSGTAMRLANLWMPLLNARVQGTMRTARAARDDPYGFATRMMALAGVPQVLSYAWNRTMFPDLYEQIPTEERMRNHIVMFGSITDSNDRVKPAYLRIPKDPTAALFTVPMEHIMDAMWHTRYHGQPLEPNQRTDESTSYMAMRALGSLLPTDNFPNELTNPLAMVTSVLSMNPIANVFGGIKANEDPFRRVPIVPDEQMALPPEYRYGAQTPDAYKALSHVATGVFKKMGFDTNGMDWLAPSTLQFAVRGMGGTLPDYMAQQLDVAIPKLQEIGLVEPGAFMPANVADLGLPPGTPPEVANLYLSKLEAQDQRPLYMRLMSRFIGSSARASSMQERASHLGPREQEQATQTQAFNRNYQNFLVGWRQRVAELDSAPDIPHQTKLEQMQRLNRERAGSYKTLQDSDQLRLAITDQRALRDFQQQLPGIGSEWMQNELPALPQGWTGEKIAQYLKAPPGVDLGPLNAAQRYQAQRRALNTLSQQLGQPLDVLQMYAGMHTLGAEVPAVAVPNLAIEEAVNRYMNPVDHNKQPLDLLTAPGHLVRRAQDAVIQEIGQEWHVPPDQVEAAINARTVGNPLELNADGVSRLRGTMLWRRLHDPDRFPDYVNPDGTPLGDEATWAQMDVTLAQVRDQYHGRLPPMYAQWDAAKKFAEQRRIQALATANPEAMGPLPMEALADHDRWYGTGRQMTGRQWAEYQSGALPRYKSGTVDDWAQWDLMQKMYAATPAGPMKNRMRNQVRQIRKLQTPGWREILQQDQLLREEELWGGDTET